MTPAIMMLMMTFIVSIASADSFPFTVFDGIKYKNKPSSAELGMAKIRILGAHALWDKGQDRSEPNEDRIRAAVRNQARGRLICLDVENWSVLGSDAQTAVSIAKLSFVINTARDERPDLKYGFYGIMPIRDYWRANRGPLDPRYQQWIEQCRRVMPLSELVDVLFPSIYTFYDDESGWESYARENLDAAKMYNKPIYPFIWPQYHPSTPLGGGWIPADYWRKQLNVCRQNADGLVIWGWSKELWDSQWPWWAETVSFMEDIRGFQD